MIKKVGENPKQELSEEVVPLQKLVEEVENRNAMPWDLLFPGTHYVPEEVFKERFSICESCEFLSKRSPRICKKCLCWMKQKATIAHAYCPMHKWLPYKGETPLMEGEMTPEIDERLGKLAELQMWAAQQVKIELDDEENQPGEATPEEYNPQAHVGRNPH